MTKQNKRELQRQIENLQREMNKDKVAALTTALSESSTLISAICVHNLSKDDCAYLGRRLGADFSEIYDKYDQEISARKLQRQRKNDARSERLARQKAASSIDNPASVNAECQDDEMRTY
ncbi:hypothetical protein [Butyrivibrio sp.]|uniref:hypothetical protein n=1 Tax=Butyrivibrio sp. TaxID=28121 RepID=UPI0025BA20BF|nr:hypothetical protein [Butyrivibrio sp.]